MQEQGQSGVMDAYPSIKYHLQMRMVTEMDDSKGWQLSSLIFQKSWAFWRLSQLFRVIGSNAVQYVLY